MPSYEELMAKYNEEYHTKPSYDGYKCPFCNGINTIAEEVLLYGEPSCYCEDCDTTFDDTDVWYEKVGKHLKE